MATQLVCTQLSDRPNLIYGTYGCKSWSQVEIQQNSGVQSYVSLELIVILITYSLILNAFVAFVRIINTRLID